MVSLVVGILFGAAIVLCIIGFAGLNKRVTKLETSTKSGPSYQPYQPRPYATTYAHYNREKESEGDAEWEKP